jgi:hypothetical protein
MQDNERPLHFGIYPGFARLSFWKDQNVDKGEDVAVVE